MSAAPHHLSNLSPLTQSRRSAADTWTWIITLFSVFLIIFGTLAMVLLQKNLQEESFDLRQQAAEIKQCNENCNSNAECEVNHFCYQGRCRLADNPGNANCEGVPDQGLNFGCDHYCADSRECAVEFTCLENRCRRPDNPDDQFCRPSTVTIQEQIRETCNDSCTSHADCALNMRCYGGSCRLASNPSHTNCLAKTTVTTTVRKPAPKPSPTPLPKGGREATQAAEATGAAQPATPAAIIRPNPSPSPATRPTPVPLPEEKTALDTVLNSLRQLGVPVDILPVVAVAAGVILLLLVLIPKIMEHFQGNQPQTGRPPSKPPQLETHQLEHSVQPQAVKPQPIRPQAGAQTQSTSPQPANPVNQFDSSSMINRLKEKNIQTPKG